MKIGTFLTLISLAISMNIMAMGQDGAIAGSPGTVSGQANPETLQAVIEANPQLQTQLNLCYDAYKPNESDTVPVSTCLWNSLDDNEKNLVRTQIEQAQEAQANNNPTEGSRISNTLNGVDINSVAASPEDSLERQALKKLGDFYQTRLDEAFKTTDDRLNITDQSVYFQLAKTQIGKNILSAWSSVCIDAGFVGDKLVIFKSGTDRQKAVRKENINALQTTVGDQDGTAGKKLTSGFFNCVPQLIMVCREQKGTFTPSANPNTQTEDANSISTDNNSQPVEIDYKNYSIPDDSPILSITRKNVKDENGVNITTGQSTESLKKESQQRACEITAFVDGLRRQLKATERVAEILNTNENIKSNARIQTEKTGRIMGDVDFDRLTTVTSGDVVAEGSYYKEIQAQQQRLQDCKENAQDEQCASLVADTDEEKERIRNSGVAFMLETEVIKEKISEDNLESLSPDEQKLILRRLDPSANLETGVKEQIERLRESFTNERDALVRSLSSRVQELEENDPDQLQNRTTSAVDKLSDRGNDYVQLMHFNNVISGYLTLENGQTNVRVLDLELENVANLEGAAAMGDQAINFNANYADSLRESVRDNNQGLQLGAEETETRPVDLSSDKVDQFFDYQIDP